VRTVLKIVGILLAALVLIAGGFYVWASGATSRTLARTIPSHTVAFPIPFPLSDSETVALRLDSAAGARLALERAVERGRHLVASRYACSECHGQDFGGGVMMDFAPIARLKGPNLTAGAGSRTRDYGPADWDRIVRHGIRPDGTPAAMPSEDFARMTDQELSDVVAYLRAQPAVDREQEAVKLGPMGKVLMAMGKIPLSADVIASHDAPHAVYPPETGATVDFGRHVAAVCVGCHAADLAGGPIAGGDPSWAPAANLTPDSTGIGSWTYEQFTKAMRDGTRPDGTALRPPMTNALAYTRNMTEVEMEALWRYLRSVPAVPSRTD
jgi:mono/diheme cytochrome c family protein